MRGSRATRRAKSVELCELAPQHLTFKVRRVTSWRAFRWFEGFPEVAQQALDVVSLDDEGAQFESAVVLRPLLGVAALIALLDVDLERAAHELRVRAIWSFDHSSASSGAMCWRLFAVRMRRVRVDLGWRWWHHQGAQLRCRTEYTCVVHQVKPWWRN